MGTEINAYLGIDIGSISTNLVLINEDQQVIAKQYLMTAGKPIEAVKQGLDQIQKEVGSPLNIVGVGTTGSGRHLIGELVGADIIKNEITAQATAAIAMHPEVDTVFEIGGQDSKYISIKEKAVVDFAMNKVCAAGTGSFLEEQAEKLGVDIKTEFARLAQDSKIPAPLGDRCTVFIESELNNQQQKGTSKEDLAAGLAVSIVKNYLNKVVGNRRVGKNILFQGGVAFNQAVVQAFEKVTGKKITIPFHHEVTGAVGIALLALRQRTWQKSSFKGFHLSHLDYQTRSFECKSCANLCEINMIIPENEDPLFYGGRCEKWENRKKETDSRKDLPDLFKERDEIIFSQQAETGEKKKIGIPRVLFFYERFPFWQAFFSSLGYEVILSSPTGQKIIQESLENISTEACFPITLAHGHILDLMEKKVDYIFLPSMINMEKTSPKFSECFNCPFIQALPYFAKSGIRFERRIKLLSPSLEPARGSFFLKRQLVKLGKSLGKSRKEVEQAFEHAQKEHKKIQDLFKQRGKEILAWIKKEHIPALAIISRPYNGSDPALNLNIPKKLKEMGIVTIPIDYLPVSRAEIAEEFPNMYWNYGQKILAAARFINQHPRLSAIHITNFRCGPDSFIAHLIKETIAAKPYLEIEVDEHASDTGVVTRLEAFLDSLANHKKENRAPSLELRAPSTGTGKRTLYIPRMSDHTLPLAAAIRAYGMEAEVLPPSDARTLEIGRKYSSGKECHPFVVTTGDFLKKIMEPGFDPARSAFLMPSASGPCRFGNYHKIHRLLFERLGYGDVPIFSPDAKNSYRNPLGLSPALRRLAWRGIVATDLLTKLTFEKRPHERIPGETDELNQFYLKQICKAIEGKNGKLFKVMQDIRHAFASIPLYPNGHKPVIGIVGEIFLRSNPECNANIVRRIEALGAEAWVAPHSEWIYYTNLGYIYESSLRGLFHHTLLGLLVDQIQKWDEHRLAHPFRNIIKNFKEPSSLEMLRHAAPYLHHSFKGEAVLTIGKAIDFINKGAAGIINIMPFTCMPGTVVAALSRRIKEDYRDIPWLDLPIDGNEGVNLETRLEAFIHQALDRRFELSADPPRIF